MPTAVRAVAVPRCSQDLRRALSRLAWRALALACVALGATGAGLPGLPGLPTVPFLLVAAWAGSRGWPALEARLLAHPKYGPDIRRWRDHGAVPRRAKWASSVMMVFSTGLIAMSTLPLAAMIGVPAFMACVAIWLWRRPER